MNPTLESQYGANRLSVTRQLRYSSKNSNELDLVLSINGLPVITAELKNPMTGQTVENAIRQYKKDRDYRELLFDFKKRALVHFAMDTELAYMTTRLAGSATFFLPFNQGDEGGQATRQMQAGIERRMCGNRFGSGKACWIFLPVFFIFRLKTNGPKTIS